jgi:hypothetical protein
MTTQTASIGDTYRTALVDVAARAREVLPVVCHSRLDKALIIAQACGVVLRDDGTADVMSQSAPNKYYHVNGKCQCPDAARAPFEWCKHRLAKNLAKRATRVGFAIVFAKCWGLSSAEEAAQRGSLSLSLKNLSP